MRNNTSRYIVVLGFFVLCFVNSKVYAQLGEDLSPPPVRAAVDSYGVNLITGTPAGFGGMYVSIGTEQSGIQRDPGRQRYLNDNHTGTLTEISLNSVSPKNPNELDGLAVGTYIKVDALGTSAIFKDNGGSYQDIKNSQYDFSCSGNICTYTISDGTVAEFDKTKTKAFIQSYPSNSNPKSVYENVGLVTLVTKPDGEEIVYTYQTLPDYLRNQPSAVVSSLGWMINYQFGDKFSEDTTDSVGYGEKITSTRSIQAINLAEEYCDPSSNGCGNLTNTWPESSMEASWHRRQNFNQTDYSVSETSKVVNALGERDLYSTYKHTHPATDEYVHHESFAGITHYYTIDGCDWVGPPVNFCYTNSWTDKVKTASARGGGQVTYNYPAPHTTENRDGLIVASESKSRLLEYTDNLNRKTKYTYIDQWGNRVDKVIDPDATPSVDGATGGYTDYDYDSRHNITAIKVYPKNGGSPLVTSATYPSTCSNTKTCNKPTSITSPKGVTTNYTYHPQSGKVATITKPAVNGVQAQTRYTYEQQTPKVKDSGGNLVNSTPVWRLTRISSCRTMSLNACVGTTDEKVTVIEYNHNNVLPTSKTTMLGDGSLAQTTVTEYDIYGNVKWVDGPRPGAYDRTYYFYDVLRQKIGEIGPDPDGSGPLPRQAKAFDYNPDGKITSIRTGTVTSTSLSSINSMTVDTQRDTEYDPNSGLPIVERFYAGGTQEKVTQKSYDNRWNLECEAIRLDPDSFDNLPASACDLGTKGPYGNDRITHYTYDQTDALTITTQAYGTNLERDYRINHYRDDNGLLEEVEDGKGNLTFYEYDDYKRPWKTIYATPGNGATPSTTDYTQITYSGAFIQSERLRDGQVVSFTYDPLGRAKTKSGAVSESYVYDNFDQVTSITNNTTGGSSATSSFVYNALGWKYSETTSAMGTVNYQYDDYGRRERLTWPDNFYVTYDYTVNGYPSDYLQQIKEYNSSTILASFEYDDYGRRDSLTRGNGVVTDYQYDDLSRLDYLATNVAGTTDDIAETFSYTVAGQLSSRSLETDNPAYIYQAAGGQTNSYSVNALNQVTGNNGSSIAYDGRGNLDYYNGVNYSYNANNLLTQVTVSGAANTSLTYDAENRLSSVSKSGNTTRFMYDGQDLIAETNSFGTVQHRYVHGPGIDDPIVWYVGSGTGTKRYFHENHQGSIIGVTNQSGATYSISAYDEYGNQAPGNTGRFSYTGQIWLDEIGLYYYKARLYNPELGRFMQTDPIGYEDGINWYLYTKNDPVNLVDPSGLMWLCRQATPAGGQNCSQTATANRKSDSSKVDEHGEDPGIAPADPKDIPHLKILQGLAQQAANAVDANLDAICTGKCKWLPWLKQMRRGTAIHKVFADKVRALNGSYDAEVSYKSGVIVPYGTPGSVRADATYGDINRPQFVVELKTGRFNYMSRGEARAYLENLPRGTPIYPLKVD